MRLWKVLGLIVISHFLARNKNITKLMDVTFEKIACCLIVMPLLKFVTGQKGWESSFDWNCKNH